MVQHTVPQSAGLTDTAGGVDAQPLCIYTIGYGSREMAAFIAALKRYEIGYVVDIRSAPYSKFKPEFSKNALESHLREGGIRYLYLGDQLGGQPKDPGCYDPDGKVVYERVKERAPYREGIARIQKAYRHGLRVALMCSEGKPEACHRSKLVGATLAELGIPVWHIDEEDGLQTQAAIISELTDGQLSLFGDHDFTSRKRYRTGRPGEPSEEDDDA